MVQPEIVFVTDDSRMRDGKLDPTDEQILRQASKGGQVFQMSSDEALAFYAPGAKDDVPRRPSAVEREVSRLKGDDRTRRDDNGLLHLSQEDLHDLVGAAAETWKVLKEEARAAMTDERAEFVRTLRVTRKYTWRSVARACSTAWKTDWGSNQIAGMCICEAAAERFFEDYRKPPWN